MSHILFAFDDFIVAQWLQSFALATLAGLSGAGCAGESPGGVRAKEGMKIGLPSAPESTEPGEIPLVRRSPPAPLQIVIGGDVIPHRPRIASAMQLGRAFESLASLFRGSDATLVNFEATFGDPTTYPFRGVVLMADRPFLNTLRDSGVSAVDLANNHICDLGTPSMLRTRREAKEASLATLGVSESEPLAATTLAERDGVRVCGVAWTTLMNHAGTPTACEKSGHVAVISEANAAARTRIGRAIRNAYQDGCTAVLALVHGGTEYALQTSLVRKQAKVAAEAGAVAVLAHHPHVPSPIEVIDTSDGRRVPIFLSLGNLLSNQGESWRPELGSAFSTERPISINAWTRLGVLARFAFEPETSALRWGYELSWTTNEHADHPREAQPVITATRLEGEDDRIESILARSKSGPVQLFSHPCRLRGGATPTCTERTIVEVPKDAAVARGDSLVHKRSMPRKKREKRSPLG